MGPTLQIVGFDPCTTWDKGTGELSHFVISKNSSSFLIVELLIFPKDMKWAR